MVIIINFNFNLCYFLNINCSQLVNSKKIAHFLIFKTFCSINIKKLYQDFLKNIEE